MFTSRFGPSALDCDASLSDLADVIGPLAKADNVSVEDIIVGDPLTRDGVTVPGLFDRNDFSELTKFKADLKRRLEQQLRSGGVGVIPNSPFALMVAIYGGKYEDRQDAPSVFLIEIFVVETRGDCRPGPDVAKMGAASDDKLAQTIQEITTEQVQRFITERAEYRKSLAPVTK